MHQDVTIERRSKPPANHFRKSDLVCAFHSDMEKVDGCIKKQLANSEARLIKRLNKNRKWFILLFIMSAMNLLNMRFESTDQALQFIKSILPLLTLF